MILFRRASMSDLDAIAHMAEHCGTGLTTLPNDREFLKAQLSWSEASFNKNINRPDNEYYFFVLEDVPTAKVIGTSAILSTTGYDSPFYSYKISKKTRVCHSLSIRNDYEVLSLVNDNQGKSELCTLYLEPAWRHANNGLLLARARFLFIAHYPNRFAGSLIAEMRGVSDESGHSPFWDNMGCHFFQLSFAQADHLTVATNKQFIADLMPRNPIYIKLLNPAAQEVIGKAHASTVPAMNILLREGFRYNQYVDLFDAGPTLEAPVNQIRTAVASRIMTIKNLSDEVSSKRLLLSNTRLDFRATIGHAVFNEKQSSCIIGRETAELLQLQCGECLRVSPLETSQPGILS